MKRLLPALAAGSFLLLAQPAFSAPIKVHGSATVYEMLMGSRKAEIEAKCGLTLEVVSMGSGKGVESLVAGNCDVAMISSPLAEIAEKLNAKKAGSINASDYQATEVARSQVLFIVNPNNGVKELTLDQLKSLFSGYSANWKDVGGADAPVVVVSPIVGHGVRVAVEHGLLAGGEIAKTARIQQGSPQVLNAVAQLATAVGFVGEGKASLPKNIKQVGTNKPLPMTLFLVTKGTPSAEAEKLIAAAKAVGAN